MAKKNSKRGEWTKTNIRELKTLARGRRQQVKLPGHSREPKGPLVRRRLAWEFPWILVPDCKRLADVLGGGRSSPRPRPLPVRLVSKTARPIKIKQYR